MSNMNPIGDRFIIRGACIISMDTSIGIIRNGDILVVDGVIAEIAERVVDEAAEVVEAAGRIVLPGFIDTHRHIWQSGFRGSMPSCSLGQYFGQVMIGLAPTITAENVYAGTLLGAYEMLDAGITGVVDWANVINSPEHADAGVAALRESGIRAQYGYGWPGGAEYTFNSEIPHPEDARRLGEALRSAPGDLLTFGLALRGPAGSTDDVVISDWRLARELDARIDVHAGMRIQGVDVAEIDVLDRLGLLGPDTTYAHANEIGDRGLELIRDSGGHVSVAAYCEMIMGHGRPPISRLLALGLNPSLSIDVVGTVPGDMFSQMRAAFAYARIFEFPDDPQTPFEPACTAEDVLAFATLNGSVGMGLPDQIGTLTPGKDADIVILDAERLNSIPLVDPVGTVVSQMDTSNVETVFVRGKAVKRNGALIGVDMHRLGRLASELADQIATRAAQPEA